MTMRPDDLQFPLAVLHDATIDSIHIEWPTGLAVISLTPSVEPPVTATLAVHRVDDVRCPRGQPWGPSVSIDEVTIVPSATGGRAVSVELQSGDTLVIRGERIELRRGR